MTIPERTGKTALEALRTAAAREAEIRQAVKEKAEQAKAQGTQGGTQNGNG